MNLRTLIIICLKLNLYINLSVSHAQNNGEILDSNLRYGKLANGFTYYIKNLDNPIDKLEMRFIVKGGSYGDENNQLDFAHAIEHLAFKSAKHFPTNLLDDNKLINHLGMSKRDIFAQTTKLYTLYYFDIPLHRKDALKTGLQFFQDIAENLEFNETDVNNERGPLRQEIVYRQGGNLNKNLFKSRLESYLFPCIKDKSFYFEHNKSFSWESLVNYYKTWYRPDLMAIAIVGKIDNINEIENQILKYFSNLKLPESAPPTLNCFTEYFKSAKKFAIVEKPENSSDNRVDVYLNIRDINTINNVDYKRDIVWDIITKVLKDRFNTLNRSYSDDYFIGYQPPNKYYPAFQINLKSSNNSLRRTLTKTISSLEQLKIYGLTSEEWEGIKSNFLLKVNKKIENDQSAYWIEQICTHFIHKNNLSGHKPSEIKLWLSKLALKNINEIIKEYITTTPDDIAIAVPHGDSIFDYNKEEFNHWINQAKKTEVSPYIYPAFPSQLMSHSEVNQLKTVNFKDLGVNKFGAKEIELENGIKIVLQSLKPTLGGNQDRIMFHGISNKGASNFPKEDYYSAINAPLIVRNAGIKEIDKHTLSHILNGTSFSNGIFPYVGYNETGVRGSVSLKDIETFFQLVYLYFTNPRKDSIAFNNWKKIEEKRHLSPTYNDIIQEDFNVKIRHFLGDSSVVIEGTERLKGIKNTNMERAYQIYQQLYGDARDFTFLISGDFPMTSVMQLAQKYLGNLPVPQYESKVHRNKKNNFNLIKGPLYHEFSVNDIDGNYNMKSLKYSLKYIKKAKHPHNWKEKVKVEILGLLTSSKIKKLRFSKNASLYYIAAYGKYNPSLNSYEVGISMDCIKEELEMIRSESKKIIEQIKMEGFTFEEFKVALDFYQNTQYKSSRTQNNDKVILGMYDYYKNNGLWRDYSEEEEFLRLLSPKDIQKTAKKYLTNKNLLEFVLK